MFTENLLKLPFYSSVAFFEEEKYQNAFGGFIKILEKHPNICTMYYVLHIYNKMQNDIKISEEQKIILDQIIELNKNNNIPNSFNPEYWLETSLLKIANKNKQTSNLIKNNELINILTNYASKCSNAYIWLKEIQSEQNKSINSNTSNKKNKLTKIELPIG